MDAQQDPSLLERFVYSPLNYWGSLIGDTAMAVLFLVAGIVYWIRSGSEFWWWLILATAAGWLFWSLLEYVLHRHILHGPRTLAQQGHAHHHKDERALLASPLFVIPMFEILIWWLLSLAIGAAYAALFVGGAAAGYASFSLLHHVFHHIENRDGVRLGVGWLEGLRQNHEVHHQLAGYNFGTTTSLWDRVFGTYRSPG